MRIWLCVLAVVCSSVIGSAKEPTGEKKTSEVVPARDEEPEKVIQGHVFAWPFQQRAKMQPRGGTTTGGDVEISTEASPAYKKLQEKALTKQERDRRAILAMVGEHRVSFDFIEVLGLEENYEPPQPYFSWATEKVVVLEEKEDFISLQHLLVMFFKDKDGKEGPPMVMKHWRQDWTWQDPVRFVFKGENRWEKVEEEEVAGTWSHAVFQVDDSPRYESRGRWTHQGGMSVWRCEPTERPLPRREFSKRDDYDLLWAIDEITIVPNGWVHQQNNQKAVVDGKGAMTFIGKEIGVNRYEKMVEPSLEKGLESWKVEEPYWASVRAAWGGIFSKRDGFSLKKKVQDKKLWQHHFGFARKMHEEKKPGEGEITEHVSWTLGEFLGNGRESGGY